MTQPGTITPGENPHDPYEKQRQRMIDEQLRARGIVLHGVLEAMRAVPRHLFVSHAHSHRAYADEALPSQEGQTISQPYIVAVMTQELGVRRGQRVLEIGTGTGYQTAVLAQLAGPEGEVCTIERVEALGESARRRLDAMQVHNVRYFIGDGSMGWPGPGAAFDRILVTAGAPEAPRPLLRQLCDGGVLVAPIGDADTQMLVRIERHGESFDQKRVLSCRFVPLLGTAGWSAEDYRKRTR